MELNLLKPRKALNKAFLKVKPERKAIEYFKENLRQLLYSCNDAESEEFHKNLVIDFLKKTYYDPDHFINTKGRLPVLVLLKKTVSLLTKKPFFQDGFITFERM